MIFFLIQYKRNPSDLNDESKKKYVPPQASSYQPDLSCQPGPSYQLAQMNEPGQFSSCQLILDPLDVHHSSSVMVDHVSEGTIPRKTSPSNTTLEKRTVTVRNKQVMTEKLKEQFIAAKDPPNLITIPVAGKETGVCSTKPLKKGDFVCIYHGKVLSNKQANKLHKSRGKGPSYMFWFPSVHGRECIDAKYSTRIGRFINHASADTADFRRLHPRINIPRIYANLNYHYTGRIVYFTASRDIAAFEELLWDYGEKDKDVIAENQWLACCDHHYPPVVPD